MDIKLEALSKSFGNLPVCQDLNLLFKENRVNVLLGPSGCGKTSILRMVAGSLAPDAGSISGVERENLSYVFQEPRLLPWLSARMNIALAVLDRMPLKAALLRADRYLDALGLADFSQALPSALSGGMRQRVSLARAFCRPAGILLMDEPFQALDLGLRLRLLDEFSRLWEEEAKTVIFVTHDIQEALYLGDSLTILSPRPARILDSFDIEEARDTRDLACDKMTRLEHRLYKLLLGDQGLRTAGGLSDIERV